VSRYPLSSALALLIALTILLTWPQALHLGTQVAAHDDPLFSIWRLAWVAHSLPMDPQHVFDANIFHPHLRTLAYSDCDAVRVAAGGAVALGAGQPILVYNVLLLAAIVSSGMGMFVLVRYLTNDPDAALVSAVIFTLLPYRIEHFMHLELHGPFGCRSHSGPSIAPSTSARRDSVSSPALLIWLQMISSVYYGAFLGVIVAALAGLLVASKPQQARGAVLPLAVCALVAAALTLPYAVPYIANAGELGPRDPGEIATFSAHLDSYFLTPQQNWLWGWTAFKVRRQRAPSVSRCGGDRPVPLRQARSPRDVWIYVTLAVLAAALSLGSNLPIYRWLNDHVWVSRGFRAPARFAILASCALAVVAGLVSRRSGGSSSRLHAARVAGYRARADRTGVRIGADDSRGRADEGTGRLQVSADLGSIRHRRIPDGRLRHDTAVHVRLDFSLAQARERLQRLHPAGLPRDTRAHAHVSRRRGDRAVDGARRPLRRRPPGVLRT
jgi:hypothetical protein